MKVTNIVLCILIFLLAAASAAFSYMLFDKRTTLLDGNSKMAASIVSASALVAPTSDGQPVAKDALAHEKYDAGKIDSTLRRFNAQIALTVEQRDTLAKIVFDAGNHIQFKDPAVKKLSIEQISKLEEVSGRDRKPVMIAAKVLDKIKDLHNKFVSANKLLDYLVEQLKALNIEAANGISLRSGNYNATLSRIRTAVKACREELEQARMDLSAANRRNKELTGKNRTLENKNRDLTRNLESARAENNRLNKKNKKLEADLARLRYDFQRVTKVKEVEFARMKTIADGSPEARALVVGEVKAVNPEYGYVAFDLSTRTRVTSKIGEKEYSIDPQLRPGLELVVCRGAVDGPEPPLFIARIKISDIDENAATANIPAADAKAIQIGDKVIDISRIDKTKKPAK